MEISRQKRVPKGRIITFYSYKGGTGRSMAVANVAWILALSGERVLVVDWDLEAPGIHRYFHPFLQDKELTSTEGLLDFVEKLAGRAAVSSSPLPESEVDVIEYVTMLKWPQKSSLRWETFGEYAGIDLLVAGKQGSGYGLKLSKFNWIDFYEKLDGRRLLQVAREQMRGLYDYVLIDSRTGVSDTSGICTVEMPDTLVTCFTLNDQSIIGASAVVESVLAQRQSRSNSTPQENSPVASASPSAPPERPFRIFPVPTRVEIVSERGKRQVALALAQQKFSPFVPRELRSKYWGRVQLPYFPFYAFEEIPAVFGDPANEELALTTPIKQITRFITENDSMDLVPLAADDDEAERLRKEVLSWYLRKADGAPRDSVQIAQDVFDQCDSANQKVMKKLFLRLVQIDVASPPGPATVIVEELDKSLRPSLQTLISSGVVQMSGSSAFIADRKVVETWDPLRQWIKEDESFLLWRQTLAVKARSWRLSGREESGLLLGKSLADAIEWQTKRNDDLNDIEREFIDAGSKKDDRHGPLISIPVPWTSLRLELSSMQLLYGSLGLVLVAAISLGEWYWQNHRKDRAARGAALITLAQKYATEDPLISALLLTEITDYDAGEADRKFALDIASRNIPEVILRSDQAIQWLEFAPDGKTLAVTADGGAELWDAERWKKTITIGDKSHPMVSASFNGWFPDLAKQSKATGRIDRLATTNADGVVNVWALDGLTGKKTMELAAGNLLPSFFANCKTPGAGTKLSPSARMQLGKPVYTRFSPDEVALIIAYKHGTLVMVDPETGRCFDIYAPQSTGLAVFSPSGEWAATMLNGKLTFFHVQDWKLKSYDVTPSIFADLVAVSDNEEALIYTSSYLYFISPSSPRRGLIETQHTPISSSNLSRNGEYAVASFGKDARWIPVDGSFKLQELIGHSTPINTVTFDPSGNHILTGSRDNTVRIWPTKKIPPSPLASWLELITYLRNSTKVCLTADQRHQLLNETPAIAQDNTQKCEASHN